MVIELHLVMDSDWTNKVKVKNCGSLEATTDRKVCRLLKMGQTSALWNVFVLNC